MRARGGLGGAGTDGDALDHYALSHATRADFLRELGKHDIAQEADRRALELTVNPAQQALLEDRLA